MQWAPGNEPFHLLGMGQVLFPEWPVEGSLNQQNPGVLGRSSASWPGTLRLHFPVSCG